MQFLMEQFTDLTRRFWQTDRQDSLPCTGAGCRPALVRKSMPFGPLRRHYGPQDTEVTYLSDLLPIFHILRCDNDT